MPIRLTPTFRDRLAATDRTLYGGWICSGSPVVAEIMAGAGLDWLLIDMEHAPNGLESTLAQLYAVSGYSSTPVVRVPADETVIVKQVLDLGAQNILVPMISTPEEAKAVAAMTRYPPTGVRGVGSALARSARWNRVEGYLGNDAAHVSVFVQIETVEGVANARAIAETPGVDGVFVGPSDLAASMGLIGQQTHPDVVATVKRAFAGIAAAGKPIGVNAFDADAARDYAAAGARFILVGADVALLARASEKLAETYLAGTDRAPRASY
ncbi:HpcH/HpaI aldolase/citrate lyase family protein [Nocardia fluminea]|uniref:HpcH/HpaI aldolase family protein n=1 Tax=Nocardia fluminea TaxID=134984 RepID=UPI00366CBFD5